MRSNGQAVLEIFEFEGSSDLIDYRISAYILGVKGRDMAKMTTTLDKI